MEKLRVIAVENCWEYTIKPDDSMLSILACVYDDGDFFLYTDSQELIPLGSFEKNFNTIKNFVNEGRYQWADFYIEKGHALYCNSDGRYFEDDKILDISLKPNEKTELKGQISEVSIKLFSEYLRSVHKNNEEMINALKESLTDNYFRNEILDILRNDYVNDLSDFEKEIVIGVGLQGEKFIQRSVTDILEKKELTSNMDINFFFRRLFNLEIYRYIKVLNSNMEE